MSGVEARDMVEEAVRRELFGPSSTDTPYGHPLDVTGGVHHFGSKEESHGVFYDSATGQEILSHGDPLHRYGIGVLFPGAANYWSSDSKGEHSSDPGNDGPIPGWSNQEEELLLEPPSLDNTPYSDSADSDDFDLTDANKFKPSAMAVSVKCRVPGPGSLRITVFGAYYDRVEVFVPALSKPLEWWVRRPFTIEGHAVESALLADRRLTPISLAPLGVSSSLRVAPSVQVFSRSVPGEADRSLRLITIAVSNTNEGSGAGNTLFQMHFSVEAIGGATIEPYTGGGLNVHDLEEQSLDLLYRKRLTYAIGHGCSATWDDTRAVTTVIAEPMPAYQVPSLTPNVFELDESGARHPVTISMRELAIGSPRGDEQVEHMLTLYGQWIADRHTEVNDLPSEYQLAANHHLHLCGEAFDRMRLGWNMVITNQDSLAAKAFRWMNEAMLYQQIRSGFKQRSLHRKQDDTLEVLGDHPTLPPIEALVVPSGKGNWRPFQIAFLLTTLPEIVNRTAPLRSTVDLIFFPTGGGKTEAYLGASALSLLARRLRDPNDTGTDTLMRYTLRLLTTQQFQRAATLICVLEDIRSRNEAYLGRQRFGIGIWLGGESTPNTWKQAVTALGKMQNDRNAQNKFLLLKCPWCGAQMGPQKRPGSGIDVAGYERSGPKVILKCVDRACSFSGRSGLPVHVVDQDIYESRPSLVIGTVDKFAMLAWRPEAKTLFGFGPTGGRVSSPPGLIIQDELHLISGPLGSMVGLFEPIIDALCTDMRGKAPIVPKIIASTATARRYEEQILRLFGRGDGEVAIFPPHGLEEGRSFFAEPELLEDGSLAPGRRYVGVFSASLGSMQTVQVRVAAAILQVGLELPEEDRDGYWTNLNFFNSLRELGNTVTLLQSDVPDYLTGLRNRDRSIKQRWPRNYMELTSRRRNDKIPEALDELNVPCSDSKCVDICLASNIIEVGVDIDRLALMTIVGQPKTTAQYIQVSGRVGRKPNKSPGLIFTLYGAAKPRDRSHYEHFQTYHQRLYAQVEPTSVTPFASPVLKRALHAAIITYIRQTSVDTLPPYPFPSERFQEAAKILRARAAATEPTTLPDVDREIKRRALEWSTWDPNTWSVDAFVGGSGQGLMRSAGTLPALDANATIWDVPMSMRNVDAECSLQITMAYAQEDSIPMEGEDE